ncbi:MAG: alcohol dehydrogenase catalytic domain-containing protein [Hyphomonadaceae bacterium]
MDVRAAVATGVGKPFEIRTVQLRAPGNGEVLVKMAATGLCHTDLSILEGGYPSPFPVILGHEGSGVVVSCGPDVTGLAKGDHVVLSSVPECGHCRGCRRLDTNYCAELYPELMSGETPFSLDGAPLPRFASLGTFAEYCVVRATHVAKVRADADLRTLCVVGCAVATGVGSAMRTGRIAEGSTVIVIGAGGVGLNVIQGARLAGAARIICVDIKAEKEAAARAFGATEFVVAGADGDQLAAHLIELTGGGGDHVFECAGLIALQQLALTITHPGWGVCTMVGLPPLDQAFSTAPSALIAGKTIRGSTLGDIKVRTQLPDLVDWYVEGKLKLDELISHRMPLEQINEGYDLVRRGTALRAIVEF